MQGFMAVSIKKYAVAAFAISGALVALSKILFQRCGKPEQGITRP
jgi:hypothetical protein